MKKSKFTEPQIAYALRQTESGFCLAPKAQEPSWIIEPERNQYTTPRHCFTAMALPSSDDQSRYTKIMHSSFLDFPTTRLQPKDTISTKRCDIYHLLNVGIRNSCVKMRILKSFRNPLLHASELRYCKSRANTFAIKTYKICGNFVAVSV